MGPIWGRQDPGGPQVGPMKLAIWDDFLQRQTSRYRKQDPNFVLFCLVFCLCLFHYQNPLRKPHTWPSTPSVRMKPPVYSGFGTPEHVLYWLVFGRIMHTCNRQWTNPRFDCCISLITIQHQTIQTKADLVPCQFQSKFFTPNNNDVSALYHRFYSNSLSIYNIPKCFMLIKRCQMR